MAKEKKEEKTEERKEKVIAGCRVSTWVKFVNMILGGLMIFYSVVSFWSIPIDTTAVIIITFRVYEM